MPAILDKILRIGEGKILRQLEGVAKAVNAIEDDFVAMSDAELQGMTDELRPLTQGPAGLLGLESGVLAEGAPADLILFDPGAPVVIDAAALHSKSKNSPFDGRRLQGKIAGTWVGGRKVH